MAIDPLTTPTAAAAPANASAAPASVDKQRAQVVQLAQEFEGMLMTQMLRDLRRSMAGDDPDSQTNGFGAEAMTDTIDSEMGRALARSGGVGLSAMLSQAITRQTLTSNTASSSKAMSASTLNSVAEPLPPASLSVSPVAAAAVTSSPVGDSSSSPIALAAPSGPVTSAYGWRRDPFTGQQRFHSGIDIAAVYGSDVKAAAPGRVVFAGQRSGYGQTIEIEHEDGQQTRYAHLSAELVQVGDRVDAGTVIGQAGRSGRATGSHVHFEVIADGRAVDPSRRVAAE